jgi:hypothetical protein
LCAIGSWTGAHKSFLVHVNEDTPSFKRLPSLLWRKNCTPNENMRSSG